MPRELFDRLTEAGHDAVFVPDVARSDADELIAERATKERRIVVTRDYDFGHLAEAGLTSTGVVLVAPMPDRSLSAAVLRVIGVINEQGDQLAGRLTLIEVNRIRVRALPG